MDIRLLETFRAVIETRSVTKAAAAIGVTQPAVSLQIARLEETVGFSLFQRTRGRLRPTSEALLLFEQASKTLTSFDRLTEVADEIRDGQAGRLTIASHPSAAISLLPGLVAAFLKGKPQLSVRMLTQHSDILRGPSPTEGFDIGVAELPLTSLDIHVARFRLRCAAVLPLGHPLAGRDTLTAPLLSGEPFVSTLRARLLHHRIEQAFAQAGAAWSVCADTEFFASTCGLVAGGVGVAIVDPFSAATFAPLGLVVRRFEPAIFYEIGMFHAVDRDLSLTARAFWDFVAARLRASEEAA